MNAAAGGADLGFTHLYEPATGAWTLLLLHGTGGDEYDLVGLGRELAPTANLLSPRGKVLENGMPRFFRRLAVGAFDIPDLLARTDELGRFVEDALAVYQLDPQRILALGLSNGANIAASMLLRRPGLLRAAALLRAVLPYEPDSPPQLVGTDALICAGSRDPHASPAQTERLATVLAAAGAQVTVHVEPGAGHALTENDLLHTARWIAELTGP